MSYVVLNGEVMSCLPLSATPSPTATGSEDLRGMVGARIYFLFEILEFSSLIRCLIPPHHWDQDMSWGVEMEVYNVCEHQRDRDFPVPPPHRNFSELQRIGRVLELLWA